MKYSHLVFIGRFSPFTSAHLHVVMEALEISEEVVIMVGSANAPRSSRVPWTYEERRSMILRTLADCAIDISTRVNVIPINDYTYNDNKWIEAVNAHIGLVTNESDRVGLIGHSKDETSYYLKLFPKLSSVNIPNYKGINATDYRKTYFDYKGTDLFSVSNGIIHPSVYSYLWNWRKSQSFEDVRQEIKFCEQYKKDWGEGPFLTSDVVCVQSGHVLMIKRADYPGKGLWALPGGFMEKNETLENCAIRELDEETGIDVPKGALHGYIKRQHTFDAPHRDPRARIITSAYLVDINNELSRARSHSPEKPLELTKIKAGSDAKEVAWVDLSQLKPRETFADHIHIIEYMLGK